MLEKLQKVTAADVQAVAKKYFSDDTLTIGVLEPQALDGNPRRSAAATRH
jgi:zinc protease